MKNRIYGTFGLSKVCCDQFIFILYQDKDNKKRCDTLCQVH